MHPMVNHMVYSASCFFLGQKQSKESKQASSERRPTVAYGNLVNEYVQSARWCQLASSTRRGVARLAIIGWQRIGGTAG